jgi:predicted membrane protein
MGTKKQRQATDKNISNEASEVGARSYTEEQNERTYVGFEVLTAVVMKSSVFWDITPCSLLATCFHTGLLLGLLIDLEYGGDVFLRNVG